MEREYRFSPETIKEMRSKNYNLITDMAAKLNTLNGYEAGYGNPQKGKMIVNYKGQNYLIDIEPIGTMGIAIYTMQWKNTVLYSMIDKMK